MRFTTYKTSGFIGIITINRPDALNALNTQVLEELAEVFEHVDLHQIRCLILTGAGKKAFAAGADISEMHDFTRQEGKRFARKGNEVFQGVDEFPIPVIAAVNGFALGGGCELAMSCDIRICSQNAKFGQPETRLGITPGFGGTRRLAMIVGQAIAKEMIFTARMIDAKEAWRIGLVNHVYKQEELMEKASAMAAEIAGNAPIAVRSSKAAVNRGIHLTVKEALEMEEELFGNCFETADQNRGMAGFLQKSNKIEFTNE